MEAQNIDHLGFFGNMESGFDRYGPLSQSETCPSLTSSFLTVDTSGVGCDIDRHDYQEPTSPQNFTTSSRAGANSPLIPNIPADINDAYNVAAWHKSQRRDIWQHPDARTETLWYASEEAALNHCMMHNARRAPLDAFSHAYFGIDERPKTNIDPPLSRAVFASPVSQGKDQMTPDEMLSWSQALGNTYHPPTIAPSMAIHNMIPSPPTSEFEPVTPLKHHKYSSSVFASSPLASTSSSILTSHWDVAEPKYVSANDSYVYPEKEAAVYTPCSSQGCPSKVEISSPIKSHSSASGINCEAVIPQSVFACSVPGCVGKDGKPRRFRRQEHKKRHEKTVHYREFVFPCWVRTGGKPCGKEFTRRDNLNSHLKKTHGSRKNNQRNSYVATLDEKSEYFDEKWRGQLTADGLPIDHPRWPELR